MIWQLDVIVLVLLGVTAVIALAVDDRLAAIAVLGAYSILAAVLFAGLGAPDVSFVEAILGAGLTGLLLVAAVLRTGRTSASRESRGARWPAIVVVAGFLALMLYASGGLPDRGDPDAPAQVYVAADYLAGAGPDANTPNVVTAILADYRSHDTLGETLVIFTSALACMLILRRSHDEQEHS